MTQTNYTREITETICSRMSEGESLRAICRGPGMPSEGAVRGWAIRDVDGFGQRCRAARQLLIEYWADQIVAIADDEELEPRSRQNPYRYETMADVEPGTPAVWRQPPNCRR